MTRLIFAVSLLAALSDALKINDEPKMVLETMQNYNSVAPPPLNAKEGDQVKEHALEQIEATLESIDHMHLGDHADELVEEVAEIIEEELSSSGSD